MNLPTTSVSWLLLHCVFGLIIATGCKPKAAPSIATAAVSAPNSNDVQTVQSDVRQFVTAIYRGDAETVLQFTNPKIIAALGGPEKTRAVMKELFQQAQSAGVQLESFGFPAAPTFLKSDLHRFAIVPTLSVLIAHGQRIESLNYQFGVQAAGATNWTYIEGSRINSGNVRQLFPDFPTDFQFPDFYRKKL
jgi:hypothetical protein